MREEEAEKEADKQARKKQRTSEKAEKSLLTLHRRLYCLTSSNQITLQILMPRQPSSQLVQVAATAQGTYQSGAVAQADP